MRFVGTAISAFAALIILNVLSLSKRTAKKQSTDKFTVIAPFGLAVIGTIVMLIVIFLCILMVKDNDYNIGVVLIAIFISCIGIPLMLAPVKGFWTIDVNNDDICITKFFFIHRHFRFSGLSHWNGGNGQLNVYTKEGEHFWVDGMAIGSDTFEKRLKKEGIPVG